MSNFLDISPAITALRTRPNEFEMRHGWLRHIPSDHNFKVQDDGSVLLSADCECALYAVRPDQGVALKAAMSEWREAFWTIREVNGHFASHFARPGLMRRILARLGLGSRPEEEASLAPRIFADRAA